MTHTTRPSTRPHRFLRLAAVGTAVIAVTVTSVPNAVVIGSGARFTVATTAVTAVFASLTQAPATTLVVTLFNVLGSAPAQFDPANPAVVAAVVMVAIGVPVIVLLLWSRPLNDQLRRAGAAR